MARKIDNRAWVILSKDEQTSLTLGQGLQKSSWEAGEIMDKAHYKYLEIQKRAEKYLKMFMEHFEKYDVLIPEEVHLGLYFQEYITLLLGSRLKIREVINQMSKTPYKEAKFRKDDIMVEMEKLRNSTNPLYKDIYNLIMDFDRWNNFRILPREIQEPSAFKRRNKVRNLKHLELSISIPWISAQNLLKYYDYKGKFKKYYAVLVCKDHPEEDYFIFGLQQKNTRVLKEINNMFLYYFETEELAKTFAELLISFPSRGRRKCKEGLLFWPKFRLHSEKAVNYHELNNIIPSRKHQDKAFADFDASFVRKLEKPKKDKNKVLV